MGLAYQPKIRHYFSTVGLSPYCFGFDQFTVDGLSGQIVTAWERRADIRAHLQRQIPVLQRKALMPAELVAALARGEDVDKAFARVEGASR